MAPRGGRLCVTVEESDDHATVSVEDTGRGIPRSLLDRIYEPFFTTKSAQGGTGLGLAVSYGIVQDHGGTLTVDSSPSGTTFRVGFP